MKMEDVPFNGTVLVKKSKLVAAMSSVSVADNAIILYIVVL